MRNNTYLPVPDYMTALVEEVTTTGFARPGETAPIPCFQQVAGMSKRTGALMFKPGSRALTSHDQLVARPGHEIVILDGPPTFVPTVLLLAGATAFMDANPLSTDMFGALTDALVGTAPVPVGTPDLTRTEVKAAFFTLCYRGTAMRVQPNIEDLRLLAGVTGLVWLLPELAAAANEKGFEARAHRESNKLTWQTLSNAHSTLNGLARAVGLGKDDLYLEVHLEDLDQLQALFPSSAPLSLTPSRTKPAALVA